MKLKLGHTDNNGKPVKIGDTVMVARCLFNIKAHPEFRKAFRKIAGQPKKVVGYDIAGGVWVSAGKNEVLTIGAHLITIIRRTAHQTRHGVIPNQSFKRDWLEPAP